jgi:hypothetical protein
MRVYMPVVRFHAVYSEAQRRIERHYVKLFEYTSNLR